MKKLLFAIMLCSAALVRGESLEFDDALRQAVQGAMGEVQSALASSSIPADAQVAILPIAGDSDDWLAGQLKIAVTGAGKTCVEGKDDPMWSEILKEVEWDERKADILDAATIDKFGRLQSAKVLIYAFVRSLDNNERCAFFELELHATEIATKRHLWGGVFARRHYKPGFAEVGRVDEIPVELRQAMQEKLRERLADSLKRSPRLAGAKTIAFIPLAADIRGYATGIFRDAFSQTPFAPVNLDLATLSEARLQLRDKPGTADAILHGSLRDLSCELIDASPSGDTIEFRAEIQAAIESPEGVQLWSDTILVNEKLAKSAGFWETLCRIFPSLREHPSRAVTIPLAVLVGLVIVFAFLRAATRVR